MALKDCCIRQKFPRLKHIAYYGTLLAVACFCKLQDAYYTEHHKLSEVDQAEIQMRGLAMYAIAAGSGTLLFMSAASLPLMTQHYALLDVIFFVCIYSVASLWEIFGLYQVSFDGILPPPITLGSPSGSSTNGGGAGSSSNICGCKDASSSLAGTCLLLSSSSPGTCLLQMSSMSRHSAFFSLSSLMFRMLLSVWLELPVAHVVALAITLLAATLHINWFRSCQAGGFGSGACPYLLSFCLQAALLAVLTLGVPLALQLARMKHSIEQAYRDVSSPRSDWPPVGWFWRTCLRWSSKLHSSVITSIVCGPIILISFVHSMSHALRGDQLLVCNAWENLMVIVASMLLGSIHPELLNLLLSSKVERLEGIVNDLFPTPVAQALYSHYSREYSEDLVSPLPAGMPLTDGTQSEPAPSPTKTTARPSAAGSESISVPVTGTSASSNQLQAHASLWTTMSDSSNLIHRSWQTILRWSSKRRNRTFSSPDVLEHANGSGRSNSRSSNLAPQEAVAELANGGVKPAEVAAVLATEGGLATGAGTPNSDQQLGSSFSSNPPQLSSNSGLALRRMGLQGLPKPPKAPVYAASHECVTLLFADIVSFTPMSDKVAPVAVMDMLNKLYNIYDTLCDIADVYKVDTIGDCYMAATGLAHEDPQHALTMLRFARALVEEASLVKQPDSDEPVQVRVGIDSGPVMSGVIGTKRKKYTLFGSTVNTASRMEATSLPGRVHITADTYQLVKDSPEFSWTCRGQMEVKASRHEYWRSLHDERHFALHQTNCAPALAARTNRCATAMISTKQLLPAATAVIRHALHPYAAVKLDLVAAPAMQGKGLMTTYLMDLAWDAASDQQQQQQEDADVSLQQADVQQHWE